MALPKIEYPTFTIFVPSQKRKVTFRPFLVKEEKILLFAKESGEMEDIYEALTQIVNNCVVEDDFDVNKVPASDLEYIFIHLRSKSVGNIIEFTVNDNEDKKEHNITVDLDQVTEESFTKENDKPVKNHIAIKDRNNTSIKLRYPTARDLIAAAKNGKEKKNPDLIEELARVCIETVYDDHNVYIWEENNDEQKDEFLNQIKGIVYEELSEFFSAMPTLEHKVKYKNSLGNEREIVLRNLQDFFQF